MKSCFPYKDHRKALLDNFGDLTTMDLPFYKYALVRNLIKRILEENVTPEEFRNSLSDDLFEDLCSLSNDELTELIADTKYIINREISSDDMVKVKDFVSKVCNQNL